MSLSKTVVLSLILLIRYCQQQQRVRFMVALSAAAVREYISELVKIVAEKAVLKRVKSFSNQ